MVLVGSTVTCQLGQRCSQLDDRCKVSRVRGVRFTGPSVVMSLWTAGESYRVLGIISL